MDLFCFSSRNEENIRRGCEARLWAVATVGGSQMQARITKARRYLKVGSRGVLYCGPRHSFTVPFLVESTADPSAVVNDIWPEPWVLPFRIQPLGGPSKMLPAESAMLLWPCLHDKAHKHGGVTAAMNATGTTAFVPTQVSEEDWALILRDLAG